MTLPDTWCTFPDSQHPVDDHKLLILNCLKFRKSFCDRMAKIPPMLKNYLKIAWRNFIKDRQFSLLNLFGLSVGLACALLIGLWIADEYGMERYNPNDARLYQVMTN